MPYHSLTVVWYCEGEGLKISTFRPVDLVFCATPFSTLSRFLLGRHEPQTPATGIDCDFPLLSSSGYLWPRIIHSKSRSLADVGRRNEIAPHARSQVEKYGLHFPPSST